MIKYVEGDILLSRAEVIAQGIAPHDHFDHGLALSLRERWPSMVRDFHHAERANAMSPGDAWEWKGVDDKGSTKCVVNLLTQEAEGRGGKPGKATVSHVSHALKALAKLAKKHNYKSIALPKLSTGVGGLQWAEVKPLIEQHLKEIGIPVIVYETFRKGVAVDEKLG